LVGWIAGVTEDDEEGMGGWKGLVGKWYVEGERRVERVGKRYGILGYEKTVKGDKDSETMIKEGDDVASVASDANDLEKRARTSGAAEKVADAISAYVIVKVRNML
jgi:hypothetical protein